MFLYIWLHLSIKPMDTSNFFFFLTYSFLSSLSSVLLKLQLYLIARTVTKNKSFSSEGSHWTAGGLNFFLSNGCFGLECVLFILETTLNHVWAHKTLPVYRGRWNLCCHRIPANPRKHIHHINCGSMSHEHQLASRGLKMSIVHLFWHVAWTCDTVTDIGQPQSWPPPTFKPRNFLTNTHSVWYKPLILTVGPLTQLWVECRVCTNGDWQRLRPVWFWLVVRCWGGGFCYITFQTAKCSNPTDVSIGKKSSTCMGFVLCF